MPKPYNRPMPKDWWLRHPPYTLFMLRELTSVFIGTYAIILLVGVGRFSQDPTGAAFNDFLAAMTNPVAIIFHFLALVASLYHTITWFNLTPKALVIRIGGLRIPGGLIVVVMYLTWIVVSLKIAWLVLK